MRERSEQLAAVSREAGRRDDAIAYARRALALATDLELRQRHLDTAVNELRAAEEMPPADAFS